MGKQVNTLPWPPDASGMGDEETEMQRQFDQQMKLLQSLLATQCALMNTIDSRLADDIGGMGVCNEGSGKRGAQEADLDDPFPSRSARGRSLTAEFEDEGHIVYRSLSQPEPEDEVSLLKARSALVSEMCGLLQDQTNWDDHSRKATVARLCELDRHLSSKMGM